MPADPLAEYEALEKLAKAATPGPWHLGVAGNAHVVTFDGDDVVGVPLTAPRNEAYIAAANPTTVLALLAEIRALRADLERCHRAREQEYADGH